MTRLIPTGSSVPETYDSLDVSVIIAVRDEARLLGDALNALAQQRLARQRFEVIVVDDGSVDGTAQVAERAAVRPRVVRLPKSRGAGHARNAGAAAARGPVLAFTDADCEPTPDWLIEGLRAVQRADLVQGRILPTPGVPAGPFDRMLGVIEETGLYETASLFVRRVTFERAGGFGELVTFGSRGAALRRRLGIPTRPMGEDTLLGWRVRRAGGRTTFASAALVHHRIFAAGWHDAVAERARDGHFATIVRAVPELRGHFLYRRWFLSRRSAAFVLALAAAVTAARLRAPAPLLGAAPYLAELVRERRRWPRHSGVAVVSSAVTGDAVGFVSLLVGSLAARRLVL